MPIEGVDNDLVVSLELRRCLPYPQQVVLNKCHHWWLCHCRPIHELAGNACTKRGTNDGRFKNKSGGYYANKEHDKLMKKCPFYQIW